MQSLKFIKPIAFLLTIAFFHPVLIIGQKKQNKLLVIDSFCKKIDSDTSIKRFAIAKNTIAGKGISCDALDYFSKNDTIFKLTEWSLHVTIISFDYYFQNGKLVFARRIGRNNNIVTSQTEYYYSQGTLIKVKYFDDKNDKDEKKRGDFIKRFAEADLTKLKGITI